MNCPTKNPLQRDGTSQYQRMLEALKPSSAPIHEYGLQEWMEFARHYAERVNYYAVSNDQVVQGDWSSFFVAKEEIQAFLDSLERNDEVAGIEPHLALFICFIHLIEGSRDRFHEIPETD